MLDLTCVPEPDVARDKTSKTPKTKYRLRSTPARETTLTAFVSSPRFPRGLKWERFHFYAHTLVYLVENCRLPAVKLTFLH